MMGGGGMDVPFSEWLKSIRGTEKEAKIDSIAMGAERMRELDEDLWWNLHWERNEYSNGASGVM